MLTRYADDLVVCCHSRQQAEQVKAQLARWLEPRGLAFHEAKTRIVPLSEGFDFLGFHLRRYPNGKLLIKPGAKAIKRFRDRLAEEFRALRGSNAAAILATISPVIRGWVTYYWTVVSSGVFHALTEYLWKLTYKWACWSHRNKPKRCYDDGGGSRAPSVAAAAFELSYRQLDADAARLFRLLPVDPGPDVSTAAAAALTGWPISQVRTVLGRLARAHLVEAGSGGAGRWRMHDLLRLYARQLPGAGPGERDEAADRLLGYYLQRAGAADDHLRALAGQPVSAEFAGRADALAWLDAERPNLIAAVTMAAAVGHDHIAFQLPLTLSEYLAWRRRFDDWLTVTETGRQCARRSNAEGYEAAALSNLGVALREVRRFEEAISACQDAAAIYRETEDRHGEEMALNNLESDRAAQTAKRGTR